MHVKRQLARHARIAAGAACTLPLRSRAAGRALFAILADVAVRLRIPLHLRHVQPLVAKPAHFLASIRSRVVSTMASAAACSTSSSACACSSASTTSSAAALSAPSISSSSSRACCSPGGGGGGGSGMVGPATGRWQQWRQLRRGQQEGWGRGR